MRQLTAPAKFVPLWIAIMSLATLRAHPPAQDAMNFTVEGKITQHSGNKLTLNSEANMIFRVVYNEKTKIAGKDGGEGTPKDLSPGTRIHVSGDLTESGEIIAQKITIQSNTAGNKR